MSQSHETVWRALAEGGLLPTGFDVASACTTEDRSEDLSSSRSDDLLTLLIGAWQDARDDTRTPDVRTAEQRVRQFEQSHARGAQLTLGVPGATAAGVAGWFGNRLAWWPQGVPAGRRVALVSSRLGRSPDTEKAWFTVLRAACGKIDRHREILLTTERTSTARYVERSAALFGLRILRVNLPKVDDLPAAKWLLPLTSEPPANENDNWWECHLSPPLNSAGVHLAPGIRETPLRDRALLALSDRVFAFRVRSGGHVQHLLRTRLHDPAWPAASVYVALGPKLVRTEMAEQLMGAGAVGWVVLDAFHAADAPHGPSSSAADTSETEHQPPATRTKRARRTAESSPDAASVIPFPSSENWSFLTHCTRRRQGPWPGQDESQYLDDLILARPEAAHSAFDALRRILRQQRLVATSEAIRGATPVVSLTAVPLAELHRLRVFRPHRGRWDFEPYGICIHRDWLQQQGAQPVRYGDDQLWESLSPAARPFFQLRRTRRASQNTTTDWSVEDEWRVVGDVDLAQAPDDAALVFVPTQAEANQLAAISRWPVTVVPA